MAGRHEIKVDWNKVDNYLKAQCDGVGIAGILGMSPDTLYRKCLEDNKINFEDYSRQKKTEGKELIRAKQFQTAMEGDKTMLIWLGKQYCEQRDKNELMGKDGKDLFQPTVIVQSEQAKDDLAKL